MIHTSLAAPRHELIQKDLDLPDNLRFIVYSTVASARTQALWIQKNVACRRGLAFGILRGYPTGWSAPDKTKAGATWIPYADIFPWKRPFFQQPLQPSLRPLSQERYYALAIFIIHPTYCNETCSLTTQQKRFQMVAGYGSLQIRLCTFSSPFLFSSIYCSFISILAFGKNGSEMSFQDGLAKIAPLANGTAEAQLPTTHESQTGY
jgi:hypothetical protein